MCLLCPKTSSDPRRLARSFSANKLEPERTRGPETSLSPEHWPWEPSLSAPPENTRFAFAYGPLEKRGGVCVLKCLGGEEEGLLPYTVLTCCGGWSWRWWGCERWAGPRSCWEKQRNPHGDQKQTFETWHEQKLSIVWESVISPVCSVEQCDKKQKI